MGGAIAHWPRSANTPLRTEAMPLVCRPLVGGSGMVSPEARAKIAEMFASKRAEELEFPGGKPIELRRRDWEAEARTDVLPKGARFSPADANGVKSEWMEMPLIDKNRVFLLL